MIVKYQIWITIYWQYRQLSLHPRLYGNVGMFGSQVASHDHCLLYSASLIKTNNSKRCDIVLFANLIYLKNFCKVEKDSERSLTFLAPIFISVQFPVGKWESLLPTFNCLLFFYSWQINLANMIYPIRAPMALFLPVGSLWKDWLQLKPACGRRSNFPPCLLNTSCSLNFFGKSSTLLSYYLMLGY